MKITEKANIAVKMLSGETINFQEADAGRYQHLRKILVHNAYRAFLPHELEITLAGLYAGGGGRKLNAIQVGANNGKDLCHKIFHKYFAKVILVEPQNSLINELQASYQEFPGLAVIENLAIGLDSKGLVLHIPDSYITEIYISKMRRSPSEIVSTNRAYTLGLIANRCRLSLPETDPHVVASRVNTIRIEELVRRHNLTMLDFVQVDCEGYDWQALKTLGSFRPAVIRFESNKLNRQDQSEWKAFAKDNGYDFFDCGSDTIAIKL